MNGPGEGEAVAVADGVHWIGAFDPDLRSFDIILKTANGTTYNAYVVRGSAGVAVVDTVKAPYADDFFARLEAVADYSEIRFIILNHLEPDHTGALPELMRRAPQAEVFISKRAQSMLKGLLKHDRSDDFAFTTVVTGDSVDLGDRTLKFLNTPFLHWPDTQCTWLEETGTLFSGDIFGCHFCDPRLFNDRVGDFRFSFEYYYAHIMRPFKEYVLEALALIEPLPIQHIAPAHGPILRDRPREYVERYHQLSDPHLHRKLPEGEKSLLVFYISAYGNTEKMARAILHGAEQVAGIRAALYDLEGGDPGPFVDLIEDADALLLGSPTINGDAVKPVWDLLASLVMVNTAGKMAGAFGSYGWSGEAVRMVNQRLKGLKMTVPFDGLRIKLIPTESELQECEDYGRRFAQLLVGNAGDAPRVVDLADLA